MTGISPLLVSGSPPHSARIFVPHFCASASRERILSVESSSVRSMVPGLPIPHILQRKLHSSVGHRYNNQRAMGIAPQSLFYFGLTAQQSHFKNSIHGFPLIGLKTQADCSALKPGLRHSLYIGVYTKERSICKVFIWCMHFQSRSFGCSAGPLKIFYHIHDDGWMQREKQIVFEIITGKTYGAPVLRQLPTMPWPGAS